MEPYQEKASTSEHFFPCTRVKISAGGVVQTERIITTSVIEPSKKLPCEIRGCGRYFGNKGALTTHMMLKHPGQRPTGQTTIQLKGSGSRKFPVPFWKFCAAFVLAGIFWKSMQLLLLGHLMSR